MTQFITAEEELARQTWKRPVAKLALLWLLNAVLSPVQAQTEPAMAAHDSAKFKRIQKKLEGCWKSHSWQFKYVSKKNIGYEFHTPIHSSAPFFALRIKTAGFYLEWIEITGGENTEKIIRIRKNRLILENEYGNKIYYKRNGKC